jgi:hypothetical protein
MMDALSLIVLALATYRITRLMTTDIIFDTPRNLFWKKFPPETSKLGYLFTCEWCLSIWVASLLFISAMLSTVVVIVAVPFALSAIAGLLTAYEQK